MSGYNQVGSGLWWDVALGQTGFTWWGVLVEGSPSSLASSQLFYAEKEFPLLLFSLCNLKQFKFGYLICVSEPCWTPRDGHKRLGGIFCQVLAQWYSLFSQQVNGELRGLFLGAHLVIGRVPVHRPSFYEVGLSFLLSLFCLWNWLAQ